MGIYADGTNADVWTGNILIVFRMPTRVGICNIGLLNVVTSINFLRDKNWVSWGWPILQSLHLTRNAER